MKRFPIILAAEFNKARKRALAILVGVALFVTAADVALMAAYRSHVTAHRVPKADALRLLHVDAASASAADHPFPVEATGSPQVLRGWIDFPLRWFRFTLPFGAEASSRTNLH